MTWSILARDPKTGEIGVAIATKSFAVGALCPHGDGRLGVLATQALVNPLYARRGLTLLGEGYAGPDVVAMLTAADPGAASRQLHVMDMAGRIGAHTGRDCVDWCGHAGGKNVSVAGNMLMGKDVVVATRDAYLGASHLPFAERLLAAMDAGEAAGGDKRGRQSAALKVWAGEDYRKLDIRTDDHRYPLVELRRLHEVAQERFVAFSGAFATRGNPGGITDRAEIDAMIDKAAKKRRR